METTTYRATPARSPACCRFAAAVVKNSVAARCSELGPAVTSMMASAPVTALARPSPVMTSTPADREIGTTSCPAAPSTPMT